MAYKMSLHKNIKRAKIHLSNEGYQFFITNENFNKRKNF